MIRIDHLELELSTKCQASCPQCPRGMYLNELQDDSRELTKDFLQAKIPTFYLRNLKEITFKGTYSDPVAAKDIFDIVKFFSDSAPMAAITIHTNGSLRDTTWWARLGEIPNVKVAFALDGLEDTHHLYRVNTSYKKIIDNATAFIKSGGYAIWQFIRFSHNQHQEEIIKTLHKDLGFKELHAIDTWRFDGRSEVPVKTKSNEYTIQPVRAEVLPISKKIILNAKEAKKVSCKSQLTHWIFINWTGRIFPCCFTNSIDLGNDPLDTHIWNKYFLGNNNNLHHRPFDDIVNDLTACLHTYIHARPLKTCLQMCGSKYPPHPTYSL